MGNVQCAVEIKNESQYTLRTPRVSMYSGQYKGQLPSTIPPNGEGRGLFGKTSGTACGAVGVFTYDLWGGNEKTAKKIAIMFSAPYDHNYYYNLFALGVFDEKENCDKGLFMDMYYKNKSEFSRHHGDGKDYEHVDTLIVIKGNMDESHAATLRVNVRPFPS